MEVLVSDEIKTVCPTFVGACLEAQVKNTEYSEELWQEIERMGEKYRHTLTTESLKLIPGIEEHAGFTAFAAKTPAATALHPRL